MFKLTAFAIAAVIISVSLAQAGSLGRPCTTAAQSSWLPIDTLRSKVEALGYQVRSGKLKNACGEFYATDKTGGRVALFVDPTNGAIVGKQ
jgi:hypothetical protein